MRTNSGLTAYLTEFFLLALASFFNPVHAESLTTLLQLSPLNEVPPINNLNATGGFQVTIEIARDPSGNIISARMNFLGVVQFPGMVTITGLHIHEGEATANGQVRFDSGIS